MATALILLILAAVILAAVAFVCFYMAFYMPEKKKKPETEFDMPKGKVYTPYHEQMRRWMEQVRQIPYEQVEITTFDGLKLRGKYYEYKPGAPIELMFHGYKGTAQKDLCGGVLRCFKLGRNALLVDQRAASKSQGNVITFGVKEHKDCLCWVEFLRERFGQQVQIILCGISMGATTVLLAAGEQLPDNVIGVLADCGFSSAKEIICKVIRQMKLPDRLLYPFVRLGAVLFGGFDPNAADAVAAMKRCKLPVIFFHGTDDDFVPWQMSQDNYDACAGIKKLVSVPGAGHGLSYMLDPQGYLEALRQFGVHWGLEEEGIDP